MKRKKETVGGVGGGGAKEGEGYIAVVVVHSVYIRKSPARVLTNPPVALPLFQLARIFRRKK